MHRALLSKEAVKNLQCLCIMWLSTRKQFKSCVVKASCVNQQGNSLKFVLSMHLFTKQCNRCSVRV